MVLNRHTFGIASVRTEAMPHLGCVLPMTRGPTALSYLPKCNVSHGSSNRSLCWLALSMTEVSKTYCNESLFLVNSLSLPFSFQKSQTCITVWSLLLSILRVHSPLSSTGIPSINSLTFHLQLFVCFSKTQTQNLPRDHLEHLKMCISMWNHNLYFLLLWQIFFSGIVWYIPNIHHSRASHF